MKLLCARNAVAWSIALLLLGAWAAAQPLPTDPRLVTGELENGLRYIVRQHANPPDRAAVWLHIRSGSLNETEEQRGIAHYLEHMAFNGTENFPPGSVIPFFQSLGLTFGQHQNAFTSFDQTTYQLELPDNKPETLGKAMLFLSDVAFRMSLLPEEIDREREVILQERRARLGGMQRVQEYYLERLAPGSTFGRRLPIGTEETIRSVGPDDFRDYYSRWYVPSNMVVMVVADIEPQTVVEHIASNFGEGERRPPPEPLEVGIRPYEEARAIVASDPEIADATVGMVWLTPVRPPIRTEEQFRDDMVDSVAAWMFNRRLFRLVSEGEVAFRTGGSGSSTLYGVAHVATAAVSGDPDRWPAMLEELAREVQRARIHGFTEQELEDARREMISSAERRVEVEETRPARALLQSMNSSVALDEPVMSPQQELELVRRYAPTLTPEEARARFAELFDTTRPKTFTLQARSGEHVPTEERLVESGLAAIAVEPEAKEARERASALLAERPEPGELREWAEHEAGVWSGWLGNGVRVHYRYMDYRKDQVLLMATLAAGEIQETAETRGLTQAGGIVLTRPATSRLASTDIADLLTGIKVQAGGQAGVDAVVLAAAGKPSEIETAVQLLYLIMTDPVVETPALDQWKQRQTQSLMLRRLEPNRVFNDTIVDTVYPRGEVRVRPLEAEHIERITVESATRWIRGIMNGAPMEVAVVGDIPREEAESLLKMYFGALPSRPRIGNDTLDELRVLERPKGPLHAERLIPTKTDKALIVTGFYGPDQADRREVRLLNVATRILTTRALEEIRQKRGLTYSPSVNSRPGTEFPGFGVITSVAQPAPESAEEIVGALQEIYAAFAKEGPTAEELETAKRQIATNLEDTMREPQFWAGMLAGKTYRGATLADILSASRQYESFTGDEIRDAARRYFKPENAFTVIVAPDPAAPPQGMVIDPRPAPAESPAAPR
jgi:zinc protease